MEGRGLFVISLDFELHWGGAEKWDLEERDQYFRNARKAVEQMLLLFSKYNVHVTWATVGLLFARDKHQALEFSPDVEPSYLNSARNYYSILKAGVGENESKDPFHFASSLINKILETPNQELASHTYSHYYCQEEGQTKEQFEEDLRAAQNIAKANFGVELKSLVFPKNQFNSEYLDPVRRQGFKVVRSNPDVWFWKKESKLSPLYRAFDTVGPISTTLTFNKRSLTKYKDDLLLVPSSRFLRAYSESERIIHHLKKKRIFREMTYAAKNQRIYHLWWHPHNFGNDLAKNLEFLENILQHYVRLRKQYGFQSQTMHELYF